jgi:hypothetical protein
MKVASLFTGCGGLDLGLHQVRLLAMQNAIGILQNRSVHCSRPLKACAASCTQITRADLAAIAPTQKGSPLAAAHRRLATRSYFNANATPERSRYGVLGCFQTNLQNWSGTVPNCSLPSHPTPDVCITLARASRHMPHAWCVCARQVLRKAFPGVLLVPDICGLERLPKVISLLNCPNQPNYAFIWACCALGKRHACLRGVHLHLLATAHLAPRLPPPLPARPCPEICAEICALCHRPLLLLLPHTGDRAGGCWLPLH